MIYLTQGFLIISHLPAVYRMNGKKKFNHEQMTYTQPTYPISLIDTEQMICKLVYKTLVKNKIPKPPIRAMTHWQHTFDDKELQWKQIFTCPYTLTIDTKLRAFQYKYILKNTKQTFH